jgi:hypothetical protein
VSDLSIDLALAELDLFSLVRLTREAVSVHRLLQAVEQDSLQKDERDRWIVRACRLLTAFAPESPYDVRSWDAWVPLSQHAEILIDQHETLWCQRIACRLGGESVRCVSTRERPIRGGRTPVPTGAGDPGRGAGPRTPRRGCRFQLKRRPSHFRVRFFQLNRGLKRLFSDKS